MDVGVLKPVARVTQILLLMAAACFVAPTASPAADNVYVPPPLIIEHPSTRAVLAPGESATFGVVATGQGTITYQWSRNDVELPGQTEQTLVIPSATYTDAGRYTVVVSSQYGSTISPRIFVTVAPTLTQIRAWGDNTYGHLDIPEHLNDTIMVSSGNSHALALRRDGTVAAWGQNYYGQTDVPADLSDVVAVDAGDYFSTALKSDGTVVAWGWDYSNRIDVPETAQDLIAISSGGGHTLALKADGTIVTWGANNRGQSTVPTGLSEVTAISAGGEFSLAVRSDGTVTAWGYDSWGTASPPSGITDVIDVSALTFHGMALMADGTVVGWGNTYNGISALPAEPLQGVLKLSGYSALLADGTVETWNATFPSFAAVPADLNKVFDLATADSLVGIALRDATTDSAPAIETEPAGQTLLEMQTLTLTVEATGQGPLHYQWQLDGEDIPGAIQATYEVAPALPGHSGDYTVTVRNHIGTVTSAEATIVVQPLPVLETPATTRHVLAPGQVAEFTIAATGVGELSYQWIGNGRIIPDATTPTLRLPNLTSADTGWYGVLVTDANGTRRSPPFFLTVAPETTQLIAWGRNDQGQLQIPENLTDAIALAAGNAHMLALQRDGQIAAWGYNGFFSANVPAGLNDAVMVVAKGDHSLALRSNGTAIGWGNTPSDEATALSQLTGLVSIAIGYHHGLALKSDGTVVSWGGDSYGQRTIPAGLNNIVSLKAGDYFSLALRADGTVIAWGDNRDGQCTIPTGLTGVVAIAAGSNAAYAFKADGTVVAWGSILGGTALLAEVTTARTIAVGERHALALRLDGTVVAWGSNSNGATDTPAYLIDLIEISAGVQFSAVLRDATSDSAPIIRQQPADLTRPELAQAQFTVVATGRQPLTYQWRKNGEDMPGETASTLVISNLTFAHAGTYDVEIRNELGTKTSDPAELAVTTLPVITSLSNPRQVWQPGETFALNVTATGTGTLHYQWIHNGREIAGTDGATLNFTVPSMSDSGWYQVQVSDDHGTRRSAPLFVTIAPLVTQGIGWGQNTYGQTTFPNGVTDIVDIAAGALHSVYLRRDGTVGVFGHTAYSQGSMPSGLTEVVAISTGRNHSLALKADGTVVVWGDPMNEYRVPVGLNDVVAISAGGTCTALRSDGTVVAWGNGHQPAPAGLANVIAISSGQRHCLALKRDGTVVAWGANTYGQVDVPVGLDGVIAVSTMDNTSLALKADGTVVTWGNDEFGQATPPVGLDNVVALAHAFHQHVIAVRSDGSLIGWGSNFAQQIEPPAGLRPAFAVTTGYGFSLALTLDQPIPQVITFDPLADQVYHQTPLPLTASADSGLPVTFEIISGPATLAHDSLTLTGSGVVSIRATQAGDRFYAAATPVTHSFVVSGNIQSWLVEHFTPEQRAAAAIGDIHADPDHDQFDNLLEYALGLDPWAMDTLGLPEMGTTTTAWTYTFTRPEEIIDLAYDVEVSFDLQTWTTDGITLNLVQSVDGIALWRASYLSANAPTVFFRLRVTLD